MASGVYKGLTIELNAKTTALSTALRQSEREAKSLERELKSVEKALDFNPGNTAAFNRELQVLGKSIDSAEEKLSRLRQAEEKYGKGGMSTDAWTKLQHEIAQTEAKIDSYRQKISELTREQMAHESALGKAGAAISSVGEKLTPIGQQMESVGRTMTTHVTLPIVAAGAATVKAAVDIDTSLTNVRKTVDGTEEDYQNLKDAAIEFSKTNAVSASQLLDIEALGAQLGYTLDTMSNGKSEVQEFGEVVSGLDIATNMNAEQAGTQLAQFFNIMQENKENTSRFGSAIVELGNNFATTESDVSEMAMRIAGAGKSIGLTSADVLGLSAALTSLGINAEAGGTAISTIMSEIDKSVALNNDALQDWADTAGMTAQEFADAWKSDPVKALEAVLKGMQQAVDGGGNLSVILDELGIDSLRQTDLMKRLANSGDLMERAVSSANRAWQENTALAKEVENRNNSLEAKFEMLRNRVTAVAEEIGKPLADALLKAVDAAEPLFEAIENGARAFSEMSKEEQEAVVQTVAIIAALGPSLSLFGKAAQGVEVLGGAMEKLSGVAAMVKEAAGVGLPASLDAESAALAKSGAQAELAGAAMGGLQAAMVALTVGGIAVCAAEIVKVIGDMQKFEESTTGLRDAVDNIDASFQGVGESASAAGGKIYEYGKAVRETSEAQGRLASDIRDTFGDISADAARVREYIDRIKELQASYDGSAAAAAELQVQVDGYNSVTGDSLTITNSTTGELSKSTAELERNAAAWEANARAQAATEMYKEAFKNQLDIEQKLADATEVLNQKTGEYSDTVGMNAEMQEQARMEMERAQRDVDDLTKQLDAAQYTTKVLSEKTNQYTAEAHKASDSTNRWRSSMASSMGDANAFDRLAQKIGISADELAQKLDDAGVSSRQMSRIGSDAFAELYRNANGDINGIQNALRNLDGQGANVWVDVDDNASWQLNNILNKLWSIPDSVFTSVNAWVSGFFASGGVSPSAIKAIPRHADGGITGIVTAPTLTNIGWTGEDGAEAIVPLTNPKYVTPFAQSIAKAMGDAGKTVNTTINVTVPGMVVREDADIDRLSEQISRRIAREVSSGL